MQQRARVVHVILTRFNCRFVDKDFPARTQPGWLESRFELFERYCLPTMKAQTDQNFEWAVFFDAQTPDPFIRRARELFKDHPNFHIRFLEVYTGQHLKDDLKLLLADRCDWLVSTRLDNDDGLGATFVEQVQRQVAAGRREAINFAKGLLLGLKGLYVSRQASNAFLSLSEPFDGFETVLYCPHKEMSRFVPIRDVEAPPLWLQVIHGGNISNKLRGRRMLRAKLPSGFESVPELSTPTVKESAMVVYVENMTVALVWAARDFAAQAYRRLRALFRRQSPDLIKPVR
ncbi:glycosyltransferase [Lichenifustis flavocetrariae]|uniref:Rhamnosyl transferase n=1 Tax=Lichenifustis flavocetrariae TaxID=2949735 RepID=A0AA41Z126_9HYPH|nr:glycosyltransferase [Lichenifustis flavocetrariae]MCW6508558.1 putative rhamnosyl transferase [Lichenifustis flavocetrariae]